MGGEEKKMPIRKADIRSLATDQSYERGQEYYETRAVTSLQQRGGLLIAEVFGSGGQTYHVKVELSEDEILSSACTCPYDWGGICKHIVAVLLNVLHQPEQVDLRASVEEVLAGADEASLRDILREFLTTEPRLIDGVEAKLKTLNPEKAKPKKSKKQLPRKSKTAASTQSPLKVDSFRKQARQILEYYRSRRYYNSSYDLAREFTELFRRAEPLIQAGDGRNALRLLTAVMEPFIGGWDEFDYDGEVSEVFHTAEPLFTEALLAEEFSKVERDEWKEQLRGWQKNLALYSIDMFAAPIAAAEQGWDFSPLKAVLEGNRTTSIWKDEAPFYAVEVAQARLKTLERQERFEEYLLLAKAEGQQTCYLPMLVQLGRGEEALQYAREHAESSDDALALAKALFEQDQPQEAFEIAELGLTLSGVKTKLYTWLREHAAEHSNPELALRVARQAFFQSLSLKDYLAVAAVAGTEWELIKTELLARLKGARNAYDKIDIYLHEGMLKEAMKSVDSKAHPDYYTVQKVVEVVWEQYPRWTIKHCKKQAEPIMDAGKSKYYHHAVRWVERAGKAYRAAKKEKEWQDYLSSLIQKHTRKYSLRSQLEALRHGH